MPKQRLEWTDEEVVAAGLDPAKVRRIVGLLRQASRLMEGTGLHVYGQSGSGHLVHVSRPTHVDAENCRADRGSSIADLGDGFDGGDW